MLIEMEQAGILDPTDYEHIGAIQLLLGPLLQIGAENFASVWNTSPVRSTKGHGGIPLELHLNNPHPKVSTLPKYDPSVQVEAMYEQARPTDEDSRETQS